MLYICYPKCTTCQKAQQWLDSGAIPYESRDIKVQNPTLEELTRWHKKSGLPLKKFFNTSGILYKASALKDKLPTMSEEEQLALLATDGMLIKRPIIVADDYVLVGFKEAEWSGRMGAKSFEIMLMDMIKEQQMKLGYAKETIRLYMPETSLRAVIAPGQDVSEELLGKAIEVFEKQVADTLGNVKFRKLDSRYCIMVSPQGSEYVHREIPDQPFLADMIGLFSRHDISIQDVKDIFEKHSTDYACVKQDGTEFDYLLYFTGRIPLDGYFYCVKFDHGHASYHRFNHHDIKSIV